MTFFYRPGEPGHRVKSHRDDIGVKMAPELLGS
jgi:hypothetical protein